VTPPDVTPVDPAPDRPRRAPVTPIPHQVSTAPFDPYSIERMAPEQERYYMASQWRMMWWKFLRHRVAVASGIILIAMYASILISEFLAPYNLHTRDIEHIFAPPQALHLFDEGAFIGPFVYGYGARSRAGSISSVRPRTAPCSCSAPIDLGATCCRACSMAAASR
jgi:hypothetical protein